MPRLDDTSEQNILNMLMENKIINAEQMKQIQSVSKEVGKTKLETALDRELTSEDEIRKTLSESYSLPRVELKNYKLDNKLKKVCSLCKNINKSNENPKTVVDESVKFEKFNKSDMNNLFLDQNFVVHSKEHLIQQYFFLNLYHIFYTTL